ncbi:uncharacterized protein AKAME5_000877400 [Lates japonicus]|uniref:Uncharacterized protein n=1 Tax=Lates japonicus TaxID=270547 RepID=A0AAD3MLL4_LATJO|nr:uncharacterized protein AKAME5_000877400 [Lates japonicus]
MPSAGRATKPFHVDPPGGSWVLANRRAEVFLGIDSSLPKLQATQKSLHLELPSKRPARVDTVWDAGRTAPVLVNGRREVALLDSACYQTVVLSSLVPREKRSEDRSRISCIHGDEHVYPTAEVYLTAGQTFLVSVVLAPTLPYPVILGNDVPTLYGIMHQPVCKSDKSEI